MNCKKCFTSEKFSSVNISAGQAVSQNYRCNENVFNRTLCALFPRSLLFIKNITVKTYQDRVGVFWSELMDSVSVT